MKVVNGKKYEATNRELRYKASLSLMALAD